MSLAAGGEELLCLAQLLESAHPLTKELFRPLDSDLDLRNFRVIEALGVVSKGLLRVNILEEHFMLRAVTLRVMFQGVSLLSLMIFRCLSTLSGGRCTDLRSFGPARAE